MATRECAVGIAEKGERNMENEKRLIDANPIVQFIMDGLNNPDKLKALGHDAIEILAEIEFAPTVDAVEVIHAKWENVQKGKGCCSNCHRLDSVDSLATHCRYCGAKMDGDGNV
jgi:hypothetical protein